MTAKCFFSEDVERECSVVREKERKIMLEEETGSEGEAGPVMSAKYTNMFTHSLVSESHILHHIQPHSRTEVTPFSFQDSGLNFAFC